MVIDLVLRFIPAYISIYLFAMGMEKVRESIQFRLKSSKYNLEKAFNEVQKRTDELADSNRELHVEISERKRIEKALRQSESFLDEVIESIQEGINVFSPDLTIEHTNSFMKKWFPEKVPLVGQKCHKCYHDADAPCDPCPTLRCLQSGQAEREIVAGSLGTGREWLELYSFPIKDKETGRIFEPFYTKKVMGRSGTGLGMAVVWGTVKDHKGYIQVDSDEGRGTTFKLYFPVTREQKHRQAVSISVNALRGRGERILVVDDVEEQRTIALNNSVPASKASLQVNGFGGAESVRTKKMD